MSMQIFDNFIGGISQVPMNRQYLDNYCPSTGTVYSKLASSDAKDVELAFDAAQNAFVSWSVTPVSERAAIMQRIADLLESEIDDFARAESLDQGKPVQLAKNMDMRRCIENFLFFAGFVQGIATEQYSKDHYYSLVERKPVGVVGLISPWNLPLYLLTWKIAPAIACGNTVICKPSESTSVTALKFAELCKRAGLPDGVLNIVTGLGSQVGEAIVRHKKIPAISFTGGTATGQRIYQQASENFKKVSLELGGKNPNIIFADCDLEKAVDVSIRSSFLNQGEICLCGSRIYVEKSIADKFVSAFVKKTESLVVGDPSDSASFMGALVSKEHLAKVLKYIELAKQEGGKILTGGVRPSGLPEQCKNGYFLRPTVITGLPQSSRCVQEEIFGPVVTISEFESLDEAVALANDVEYGLSATVWTKDIQKAKKIASKLEVGTVWVNDWLQRDLHVPFGGMKHSGIGREGGMHSIDFFTETTTLVISK